ncbi:MAG: uridine kinase family protein [Candidatus Nanopelagicales bacterium]
MAQDAQYRKFNVAQLAGLALAKPARLGNCRLILIDGPAGSGKTTLAAKLQTELNAAVVHMDEVYLGWETALSKATVNRINQEILKPIAAGSVAKFKKFNWHTYQLDEEQELDPSILIIEGVGSAAHEIREHASLVIWIEVDLGLGLSRVLERDGEQISAQMVNWQVQERNWHEQDQTRAAASVLLSGERNNLATDEYLSQMK